ncbi:MAG: homoserine dehydrogenase [Phycisphaeraceae bacterium]
MPDDVIGVGMIGLGTVGGGVAKLLRDQSELYAQRTGKRIELRRVLVRDIEKAKASGLVDPSIVTDDQEAVISADEIDIVIEVAGGVEPMDWLLRLALEHGKHVVTANKSLLAEKGPELFGVAHAHGATIAFEASCGGGIPCVTALTTGLMANRIDGLFGILNGTCNYILTEMTTRGKTYAQALAEAQEAGFAEADPTLDVSGQDAAQKLAILASLAFGVTIHGEQVHAIGVDGLDLKDIALGDELGFDIKLLAIAERWPDSKWVNIGVQPCFIKKDELLAQVAGPYNALSVHGHAAGHTLYYGQGAGQMPTASAVVSDLIGIVCGSATAAFSNLCLTPDLTAPAHLLDRADTESAYYLRMETIDEPGVMAKVTSILGDKGISLSAVLQHESKAGEVVSLVVTTHLTRLGDVESAAKEIAGLEPIQGEPVIIRVIEMPA